MSLVISIPPGFTRGVGKQVTYGKTNLRIYGIVQGTIVFLSSPVLRQAKLALYEYEDTERGKIASMYPWYIS